VTRSPSPTENSAELMRPTVFIVDDETAIRSAIGLLVSTRGRGAEHFLAVKDFLAKAPHVANGCLVVDLQMPGMNGVDLIEQLAERGIEIPAIVVTAYAEHALIDRALAAGARQVFRKPFRDDELLNAIGDTLLLI
jgi:two-component system response regulator FixJ